MDKFYYVFVADDACGRLLYVRHACKFEAHLFQSFHQRDVSKPKRYLQQTMIYCSKKASTEGIVVLL